MHKQKRFWLAALAVLMLVTSMDFAFNPMTASASEVVTPNPNDKPPLPNTPTPKIPINRLAHNQNHGDGIIMDDSPVIPNSWAAAKAIAENPPKTHTGWSTAGGSKLCTFDRYVATRNGNDVYADVPYPQTSDVVTGWRARYNEEWFYYNNNHHPNYSFQHSTFNQLDDGPLDHYKGQLNQKYKHLMEQHGINTWDGVRGEMTGAGNFWAIEADRRSGRTMGPCSYHGEVQRDWSYGNNEIIMTGWIQADRKYPGDTYESIGTNGGDVRGNAYWELVRHNENARSGIDGYVKLDVNGKHFATRNVRQTAKLGSDSKSAGRGGSMSLHASDGMPLKGQSMTFGLTYDYTNFYEDVYRCAEQAGQYCYEWHFVERKPDWSKQQSFSYTGSIQMNHRMGETVSGNMLADVMQNFVVGGTQTINNKSSISNTPFTEDFRKAASNTHKPHYNLKTQSHIPITPGAIDYKVSVPSGKHTASNYKVMLREKSAGSFTPPDMDMSLKPRYAASGFPYQQSTMVNKGTNGGKRNFEWNYVTDLFYMTQHTGFIQGYDYASKMKANMMNNNTSLPALPAYNTIMSSVKAQYQADTGEKLLDDDKLLYANSASDILKLQRYMIPVYGQSPLKPNVTHTARMRNEKMGLNDLTFNYNRTFKFDRYLIGSGADDAWIIEQRDSLVSPTDSSKSVLSGVNPSNIKRITITYDELEEIVQDNDRSVRDGYQMHNFRIADREFKNLIKNKLNYN